MNGKLKPAQVLFTIMIILVWLAGSSTFVHGADLTSGDAAIIEQAVLQLASNNYEVKQKALATLSDFGEAAFPHMLKVMQKTGERIYSSVMNWQHMLSSTVKLESRLSHLP